REHYSSLSRILQNAYSRTRRLQERYCDRRCRQIYSKRNRRSDAQRTTVAARIVRTAIHTIVDADRARLSRQRTLCRDRAHLVAAPRQFGEYLLACVLFQLQRIARVGEGFTQQEA